ncbi:MAG TPA: 4-hydroxy-tetrahydrodipicolinate reductase [Woeseiaceae bacterium]|nr:4-hydroxy-tetrahydrodipicolinate reductase [Woeseiaceae bacterium]
MQRIKISVLGAGRMGQELIRAVAANPELQLGAVWSRRRPSANAGTAAGSAAVSGDLEAVLAACDVAVDFTLPAATPRVLESVGRSGKPLVCGVSGLGEDIMARMRATSSSVPLFYDRNMSFGVAVLSDLVRRAGASLGPEFVAEIRETHHVHKVDAPSGTALKLGEALAEIRQQDFGSVFRYDESQPGRRTSPDDIVFTVRREGENPGEHAVVFQSEAEELQLVHKVRHRRVFAIGALRAARWLLQQQPGLYGMRDLAAGGNTGHGR